MAQICVIQTLASSRTPSAKAIVTATLSFTAMVTQDARLTLNLMTSLSAPRPIWVHLSASVVNSFSSLPHPAATMKLQTHWVQTVALATNNVVVLAHAPPGSGARVILAVTP